MRRAWPWLVALALTALGAAAGAAYSELGPRTYTATAQLIVSPLPASDTTFTGIAVFRDSGGRRTAAQSAAALVKSAQTANAFAQALVSQRTGLFQSDLATTIQHDTQTLGALAGARRSPSGSRS